jgi:hypothetical protein
MLVVCLLLLQAGFFIVDQGHVASGVARTGGAGAPGPAISEPNDAADANIPAEPNAASAPDAPPEMGGPEDPN